MAKLKKISNSSFDLNKPVIVVGKGPSAEKLEEFLQDKNVDDFYFCAINTSYEYMPKVDFLAFCDLGVLESLEKNQRESYKKIKNLVCPLVLRASLPGRPDIVLDTQLTYEWLSEELLKEIDVNIYTFKLFTQHKILPKDERVDDFPFNNCGNQGQIISSYHCGLIWLTKAGFKNFHIFGVSKQREYADFFIKENDCGNDRDNNWYTENYSKGESILNHSECSYKVY
jgi:hypothetical protein